MFGTYCRLGLPVWASDLDVIRATRRKMKKSALRDATKRDARKSVYRAILAHHRDARDLYREIMGR